jgi:hypothetical protein
MPPPRRTNWRLSIDPTNNGSRHFSKENLVAPPSLAMSRPATASVNACPHVPLAVRNAIPAPAADNQPVLNINFSTDAAHDLFYDLLDFIFIFLLFGALYFYKDYTSYEESGFSKTAEVLAPGWMYARNPIKLAAPPMAILFDGVPPF